MKSRFTKPVTLIAACLFSGGCAMFGGSAVEDDRPTAGPATPTTVPVADNDTSTVGGMAREAFIDFPSRVVDFITGKTPSADAMNMESTAADGRREGINNLVAQDFGKLAPYTDRYRQIAEFDADPMVRATAIRALNRAREGTGVRVFIAGLSDESTLVRLESAKALANVPSGDAIPALIKTATSTTEDADIRIAAVDALRHYRSFEVARTLINQLDSRDFGLAWQARQSLRFMTGSDYRFDQTAWLNYLTSDQKPLG